MNDERNNEKKPVQISTFYVFVYISFLSGLLHHFPPFFQEKSFPEKLNRVEQP